MAFHDLIIKNFWQKLVALLLASLIWFTIYSVQHDVQFGRFSAHQQIRTFYRHPITVMKTAADTYGYRVMPSEVDVTLKGPAELINSLTEKDIEVYINLTDVVDAERLKKKVLVFPPEGVVVVEIKPQFVIIERAN